MINYYKMANYEKELFVYKYRPKYLKDIQRPMIEVLNKIVEKDTIPNFILYGQKGSGKKTLLYAFLNSRYNKPDPLTGLINENNNVKTQCILKEYKINTKNVSIPIFFSPYHVEIDIHTFSSHVRTILPVLIKEFAQTKNILDNQHKLFVIHHIEDLEMQTQHTLRRILEIYMENCRFIFISSKLNKITHPLQSRCLMVRVPVFTKPEIYKMLQDINNQLDNKVTDHKIEEIVENCETIKTAIFNLESKYYNFELDVSYEKETELLLKQIMNAKKISFALYETIDDFLYKNLYKNRCLQDLIHTTFMCLRKLLNNDYDKLNVILEKIIQYDQNMVDGSRDYMHIQSVFYFLVYYFHPNK